MCLIVALRADMITRDIEASAQAAKTRYRFRKSRICQWKSTNGQTCESIYTSKNKKSHCKQANKHGVTGNDACQCSC